MPREKGGLKGGAPKKEVDWVRAAEMCSYQCTQAEIAADQGVSIDTLVRRCKEDHGCGFSAYFKEKRLAGFVSLRHKQYLMALAGDKTMLVWLGKQWLDQRDHKEPPPAVPQPGEKHTATLQDDMTAGVLDDDDA